MPTYRLDLEYEGTRYHGWQEQKNARSIAGELRRAVTAAGGELVELGGSGRTDAGVHALRQTAHLRLRREVEPATCRSRINDALPADIHVLSMLPATDGFHARHDAVARAYLYQIARRRTAHAKRHVWWIRRPLDAGLIERAAERIAGRHDFARFCERPAEQESTVVVVDRVEVAERGDAILVRLTASHFLWKMVRRVVGVLVRIGAGEMTSERLEQLLAGGVPSRGRGDEEDGIARWTAPSSGLFLERVLYPGETPPGAITPAMPLPPEAPPGGVFTGRPRQGSAASSRRAGGKG